MIDPIQLKEVNDLIDNHEYDKERDVDFIVCTECKHYSACHDNESGCAHEACDCSGFIDKATVWERENERLIHSNYPDLNKS